MKRPNKVILDFDEKGKCVRKEDVFDNGSFIDYGIRIKKKIKADCKIYIG